MKVFSRPLADVVISHLAHRDAWTRFWGGVAIRPTTQMLLARHIDPTVVTLGLCLAVVLSQGQPPRADRRVPPAFERRDVLLARLRKKVQALIDEIDDLSGQRQVAPGGYAVSLTMPSMTALREAAAVALWDLSVPRTPALPDFLATPGTLFDFIYGRMDNRFRRR